MLVRTNVASTVAVFGSNIAKKMIFVESIKRGVKTANLVIFISIIPIGQLATYHHNVTANGTAITF